MKNWLIYFSILVGVQGWGQGDSTNLLSQYELADTLFGNLNYSLQTGKLFNRLNLEDTIESVTWNSKDFIQENPTIATTADYFFQLMYEMKLMSIDTSIVSDRMKLYDSTSIYIAENEFETENYYYPFGIVDYTYEYLDVVANASLLNLNGISYFPSAPNAALVLEQKRAQFASPMFDYFSSDTMGIIFKRADFYSNHKTAADVASIEIKVNNTWNTLAFDQLFLYATTDTEYQYFTIKITYNDSSSITNLSKIYTPEQALKSLEKVNSFPGCDLGGTINHDGNKLIWCMVRRCSNKDRILKPYLLLTGYRPPFIGQKFKKTWQLYNDEHGGLMNDLRLNDYDIFLVKFNIHEKPYKHGMEESARLLIEFIQYLNTEKGAYKGSASESS